MALNMDKIRARQQELNQPRGGDYNFFQPKDGRNVVRVLPPKGDNETFWSECDVHFNVGPDKKMAVCLKTFNKKCPVCEAIATLKKSKDKEDEKLASTMKPVHRVYLNVIDRNAEEDEKETVRVYGCGNSVFKEILNLVCDPDYGDVTDYEEGYDIIIKKKGKGRNTEYSVNAKPKQTAASVDIDSKELDEALVDLTSLIVEKPYEEIEALLYGEEYTGNSESEDDPDAVDDSKASSSQPSESEDELKNEIQDALRKNRK